MCYAILVIVVDHLDLVIITVWVAVCGILSVPVVYDAVGLLLCWMLVCCWCAIVDIVIICVFPILLRLITVWSCVCYDDCFRCLVLVCAIILTCFLLLGSFLLLLLSLVCCPGIVAYVCYLCCR